MPGLSREELRRKVMAEKGTERPFTGELLHESRPGKYRCASCGNELFLSGSKFDSGCGWPSFDMAQEGSVAEVTDLSHFMLRTEILCSRCRSHLGHVFDDGPTETGRRYCINSIAMEFEPAPDG